MIKIDVNSKGRPDNNIWIFSDPHYNHKNICRGVTSWRTSDGEIPVAQTRDFPTIEKMNAAIVNNINNCAMPDDTLICLGDWSFGGFESIREFWDRIMCKNIHLILGNHDQEIEDSLELQELFTSVGYVYTGYVGKQQFHLSHYSHRIWPKSHRGTIHLYGHSHGSIPDYGRSMDVGVDTHKDFRPYHINEIYSIMSKREVHKVDHHGKS